MIYELIENKSEAFRPRINDAEPTSWRDLQDRASQLLSEAGLVATSNHPMKTARGKVNVDVFALDTRHEPQLTYLCECKYWSEAIPQEKVHAFRSVMSDSGAHFGMIVSRAGFQSGCRLVAENTNIALLNWQEFERSFLHRWIKYYFCPEIEKCHEALHRLTEPLLDDDIRTIANSLSDDRFERFQELRIKWISVDMLMMPIAMTRISPGLFSIDDVASLKLPIELCFKQNDLQRDILEAASLRSLLHAFESNTRIAVSEFNALLDGSTWPV